MIMGVIITRIPMVGIPMVGIVTQRIRTGTGLRRPSKTRMPCAIPSVG